MWEIEACTEAMKSGYVGTRPELLEACWPTLTTPSLLNALHNEVLKLSHGNNGYYSAAELAAAKCANGVQKNLRAKDGVSPSKAKCRAVSKEIGEKGKPVYRMFKQMRVEKHKNILRQDERMTLEFFAVGL